MPQLVDEFAERIARPVHRSVQYSLRGEPAELDGKDLDEQYRQKERRQGYADHGEDGCGIVDRAVLVGSGFYSQRNGDDKLQDIRGDGDAERNPHMFLNDLTYGQVIKERRAEISRKRAGQPVPVSPQNAEKRVVGKSVKFLDTVQFFLADRTLQRLRQKFIFNVIHRQATYQNIQNNRHEQQDHDGIQGSLNQIFYHKSLRIPPFRRRTGMRPPKYRRTPSFVISYFSAKLSFQISEIGL